VEALRSFLEEAMDLRKREALDIGGMSQCVSDVVVCV